MGKAPSEPHSQGCVGGSQLADLFPNPNTKHQGRLCSREPLVSGRFLDCELGGPGLAYRVSSGTRHCPAP